MIKPDFTKYLKYDELVKTLNDLVGAREDLAKIYSIGKTYEGRDMWMVEITNYDKGDADKKPAMYIDGNLHAGEVTGSAVSLYTIWYLLENYGKDPLVTGLVDDRTFYILPRISADGAEVFLTTPQSLRSSTREYPPRDNDDGLNPEDIDGDGLILQMRVKDPEGQWKVSDKDPRVMVQREPWDTEGPFYKMYQEGTIKNWDGKDIKMAQSKWGLDANRNWPGNWQDESSQRGAGPYPLSEPETRNVAEFIINHPNIGCAQSYHTTMGAILRPLCTKSDSQMPPADLAVYRAIGLKGTECTGYPTISTFDDYAGKRPLSGIFMDWAYEHQGIIVYSTELWDANVRAGNKLLDRSGRTSREESQLNLLRWNDRELAGNGFEPWRKFDHPQLGEVELGGWKSKFVLTNPPPNFLEGECHKNCMFTLYHAACLPQINLDAFVAEKVADGVYKVTATVANKGYLPSNGSQQAINAGKAKPVIVELEGDGLEFVTGKAKEDLGHLSGRGSGGMGWFGFGGASASNRKEVVWVIKAKSGQKLTLSVKTQKAGNVSGEVVLD